LRIVSYSDLRFTTGPATGVYKHITRLVRGLAASPGIAQLCPCIIDQFDQQQP
jgi:hypothetical protein